MNISFKGYDAAPLKALHISRNWAKIGDEFQEICDKENIELKKSKFNGSFNQDVMVITEKDGQPQATITENLEFIEQYKPEIEKELNMPVELLGLFDKSSGYVDGGNIFIGKKSDGNKFLLIGSNERFISDVNKISKRYGVDKKDIHFIQQQDYHLDMSLRPIGYPYVLVNNPEMALKNEFKAKGIKPASKPKMERDDLKMLAYKASLQQLKDAGFVPIPIGGVYDAKWASVNFMNAIVNKHDDGTISYITNSSKCNDPFVSKYQRLFEKDLRNKLNELWKSDVDAPRVDKVYFVQGENYGTHNEVMEQLLEGSGGVHCYVSEEPSFEKWG